ncbi:choice-of-anchor C family protein (plasmid) [Streptomyces clavuligerus]|uniref:Secreted protein n=2 Tax=Streptomyces clavuligerus TaxID=1901 RepID=D5SK67_STRCL|nr:choice-of-anchor C family protein [Streptomyces clavuligerus]EFG04310.1 Secreted protein [Streptomyces clavuligerus]MBY6307215.1 choice-of-anchor C family protein [Streptomyces clavuligerus]QCS10207.1 choice-of-anchor C family protein [Streptomyces clavuligerus]QPJ98475.1 choice-of-anchor C family protein [Streptomyces clavuligerus]
MLAAGSGTALAAPSAAALSRFDNGSFEYPLAPVNSFATLAAGQSLGPWKVGSGSVDLIGAGFWQAAEGNQSVDLNGTQPGAVGQTFTTTAGRAYTVTYALAANPGGGPALKTGRVLIDGQNVQDFSFDSTGKTMANMGYIRRQVTFVAGGPSTTLGFASTVAGAWGPVVDDVQVRVSCGCGD